MAVVLVFVVLPAAAGLPTVTLDPLVPAGVFAALRLSLVPAVWALAGLGWVYDLAAGNPPGVSLMTYPWLAALYAPAARWLALTRYVHVAAAAAPFALLARIGLWVLPGLFGLGVVEGPGRFGAWVGLAATIALTPPVFRLLDRVVGPPRRAWGYL